MDAATLTPLWKASQCMTTATALAREARWHLERYTAGPFDRAASVELDRVHAVLDLLDGKATR